MDLFSSCNIFVVGCRACNLLLCTMHKSRCTLYIYYRSVFLLELCATIALQYHCNADFDFDEELLNFVFL